MMNKNILVNVKSIELNPRCEKHSIVVANAIGQLVL
jgi:hypothetical protein